MFVSRLFTPCYDFAVNRWLARLSFSFFIIAAILFWEIYKTLDGRQREVSEWRIALYMIACVFAIVLGALGVRARHRTDRND